MEWREADDTVGRRWERADGYAVVAVRETATGDWGVTYDRLRQAPAGSKYRHRTVSSERKALALAAAWRGAESDAESRRLSDPDGA